MIGTEFLILAAVGASLLIGFFLLVRAVLPAESNHPGGLSALTEVNDEKYRPLARLLSQEDEVFLRSQRGFQPEMLVQLRRSRRRVAREYLTALKADFFALHGLAVDLLALAPDDQPELASQLVSLKARFTWNLTLAHVGLMLHACGLETLQPMADLASMFQTLREQTQALASAEWLANPA